jgi:outer membrane protein insertion porin family
MPSETIISILQTRIGEEISLRKVREDVRELYKLGQFSDIQVDSIGSDEGINLTFMMEEWPKVSGDIVINGNKDINTSKIKDTLTIGSSRSLSGKSIQESKNKILKLYKEKGFYLAQVNENVVVSPEDGTARVSFDINEGKKITVQEINVVGNKRVSERDIKKQMKLKKGKRFDDTLYEGDPVTVIDYYHQNGFVDAKLIKSEKNFNESKTGIIINLEVEEGPQYRIGDVTASIVPYPGTKPIYSQKDILNQFLLEKGDVFKQVDFIDGLRMINKIYLDKGRVSVRINPEMNYKPTEETVDVAISITEGTSAYIGTVPINWVSATSDEPHKTKEYVIRRELDRYDIKEGKLYSSQNIEDARRRILNLGSFIRKAEPQIDLETPSSEPGIENKENDSQKVTVNFDVEESRQSGMFSVAGGYGSEGGLFGSLDIWDDNIFGRAFRLQLRGEIGTKELRTGQIVFSSPWILNTPTSLDASLYNRRRMFNYDTTTTTTTEDKTLTYRDESIGASVTVGRPITRKLDLSVGLRNESTTYKMWDADRKIYVTTEEWYQYNDPLYNKSAIPKSKGKTRSIKTQLERDTRNYLTSMFDPNGGSFISASTEFSGIGGDRFQKIETESSLFVPTWWKLVLVFHLKTGYIAGKDAKYLTFERYYLGGIQSIRGYGTNAITPKGYEQYGGNRMGQLNVEYRFPITNMVRGIIFFDAGQTWGGNQSLVKDFFPRKSVGLGVRFDFMGALARIEYGYPLNVPVGKGKPKGGKIEFDIGPSF